jgi:hypothetical protein
MGLLKIISILTAIQIMVISGCGGGGSGSGGGTTLDTTAPTVTAFSMTATATSLTVSVSSFAATDNVGITGYMITESATPPAANATDWTTSAPTSFTFSTAGNKTAYAWAKDAAGNISNSLNASVTITQQSALTVNISGMPANAYSIEVDLDFTNTTGYSFDGYIDSNGYVTSTYISTPLTSALCSAYYESTNKKLTLAVVNTGVISDGTIMSVQFQAIPGFDVTKITPTITEVKDINGSPLAITGATTVSETVQ